MLNVEKLKEYGADVDGALNRCMNNTDLYIRLVGVFEQDPNFDRLYKAFEDNDMNEAFEAAHGLKGASANLGLTPLYNVVAEVSDSLKAHIDKDYSELLDRIKEERGKLEELNN